MHFQNDYPKDWKAIGAEAYRSVGYRCIRCGHPYQKGKHKKGEWTPCDDQCCHGPYLSPGPIRDAICGDGSTEAAWRILTCHHFDGNKANCAWWNLLCLCQRCHLQIQGRVDPETPWMFEHSDWLKPYVAGFYAQKYLGESLTREEVAARMEELLSIERLA